jgi:hypothetical protein
MNENRLRIPAHRLGGMIKVCLERDTPSRRRGGAGVGLPLFSDAEAISPIIFDPQSSQPMFAGR